VTEVVVQVIHAQFSQRDIASSKAQDIWSLAVTMMSILSSRPRTDKTLVFSHDDAENLQIHLRRCMEYTDLRCICLHEDGAWPKDNFGWRLINILQQCLAWESEARPDVIEVEGMVHQLRQEMLTARQQQQAWQLQLAIGPKEAEREV
jgi:hypothetical protein